MYNIPIYEFDEIPTIELKENDQNNLLCNYYGQRFKKRFGTVVSPLITNDMICENDYMNKLEKDNICSFVNHMIKDMNLQLTTFDDIYLNRKRLYDHLNFRYTSKKINGLTLSRYLQIFSLLILYSNPFKLSIRKLSNNINQLANTICRNVQTVKYANNTQTFDYIPFDQLVLMRDSMVDWWVVHNDHMKYIRLCMNTYIPPLRLELQDMKYKFSYDEPINDPTDQNNYLVKTPDYLYIVLNHDKVVSKYGQQIFCLDQTNDYMDCDKLKDILERSFSIMPRSYVICPKNKPNEPMNNTSFYNLLPCNQNILRQSYHTYYEKIYRPSLTNADLMDLANRMRHSLNTARAVYIKVEPNEDELKICNAINLIMQNSRKERIKKYRTEYNLKYFKKDSYGYKRLKDNRYLSYLLNGKILKPSKKSLDRHGIHMIDGLYCFTPEKINERNNKNI